MITTRTLAEEEKPAPADVLKKGMCITRANIDACEYIKNALSIAVTIPLR